MNLFVEDASPQNNMGNSIALSRDIVNGQDVIRITVEGRLKEKPLLTIEKETWDFFGAEFQMSLINEIWGKYG